MFPPPQRWLDQKSDQSEHLHDDRGNAVTRQLAGASVESTSLHWELAASAAAACLRRSASAVRAGWWEAIAKFGNIGFATTKTENLASALKSL